jgi:23S rRNA pseudouridine1911/1915/1917 synthase
VIGVEQRALHAPLVSLRRDGVVTGGDGGARAPRLQPLASRIPTWSRADGMASERKTRAWTVASGGVTVAASVKDHTGVAWSTAKRHVTAGQVLVDGVAVTAVDHRLVEGQRVELRLDAPRVRSGDPDREGELVYDDAHVVVIAKPAGVSSIPYEARELGTAMDLVRDAWRRAGKPATTVALHVVHRIDRATSGLLMFAKTKRAEIGLAAQLRAHAIDRLYLCVAHGTVTSRRIASSLVADRGDGLRGSSTGRGKPAVTHVTAVRALRGSTLCEVRLETGRTHQIRIHLAESGHPLIGEPVYIRDFLNAGGRAIAVSRLMLHAQTLGFAHPITGAAIALSSPPPRDFAAVVERLS